MMYSTLVGISWVVLIAYWIVSAFGAKRSVRDGSWRRWVWLRITITATIILLLNLPPSRHFFETAGSSSAPLGVFAAWLGALAVMLGVALAIGARAYLGRNWGMPMSLREGHELVTTGPYRYLRHPIYSGIMLALLGSAFSNSILWIIPFVFFSAYFVYSSFAEEHLMREQFPDEYPAYQKRTKMLIPFVW